MYVYSFYVFGVDVCEVTPGASSLEFDVDIC